ncbi:MAG: hypothetical protein HKO04_07965 [Silicimonas sp.]|nr:hypothetical protein [Silicimonas sp.]
MAKKGGIFQTMGNLVRWTIWGLAALAVVAIWLGWSNRANGPDGVTASVEEPTVAEPPTDAVEEPAAEGEAAEPATGTVAALQDDADSATDEVRSAVEGAVGTASEAASDAGESASDTVSDSADAGSDAIEGGPGAEEVPATELEEAADAVVETVDDAMQSATEEATDEALAAAEQAEGTVSTATEDVTAAVEGAVTDDEADLNVMPEELSEIRIPGDDAVYGLVSVFQRDDGSIEVVSSKAEDGATVMTTRLVTCAPLAVGVIAEGDGPRNDTPELERIPLGSAASLIAALACGAMN